MHELNTAGFYLCICRDLFFTYDIVDIYLITTCIYKDRESNCPESHAIILLLFYCFITHRLSYLRKIRLWLLVIIFPCIPSAAHIITGWPLRRFLGPRTLSTCGPSGACIMYNG